jgi:predicted nucleic acid-binding protein
MGDAWRLWDRIWADTRVAFLPEPDGLEVEFRIHSRLKTSSPKVWGDAYLLAFATTADLRLVTFDKALESRAANVLVLE